MSDVTWWSLIKRNAYLERADPNLNLLGHAKEGGGGGCPTGRQMKVEWQHRSYHVGCGNIMQAVSRLWVLACVSGTSVLCSVNQNVCHAILPWCGKVLYLPTYKVDLHISRTLITTFNFQESTYFVCGCGVTLSPPNPCDKYEMLT